MTYERVLKELKEKDCPFILKAISEREFVNEKKSGDFFLFVLKEKEGREVINDFEKLPYITVKDFPGFEGEKMITIKRHFLLTAIKKDLFEIDKCCLIAFSYNNWISIIADV